MVANASATVDSVSIYESNHTLWVCRHAVYLTSSESIQNVVHRD